MAMAALNAIKGTVVRFYETPTCSHYFPSLGRPMSVDVMSVLQNGQRTFSFMTSCLGMMANLDLGTEHLRFMGSQYAFVYSCHETLLNRLMQAVCCWIHSRR